LSWKEALKRLCRPFPPEDLPDGRPAPEAILRRLDEAQGENLITDWWQEYRPLPGSRPALVCALFVKIGPAVVRREGVGEGASWGEAALEALRSAAWALGLGRSAAQGLEAGEAAPAPSPGPELAERARKADDLIRGIVEDLKAKGKAKEAVELILEYGYKLGEPPATEEELSRARELYRRLKRLALSGGEG